MCHVESVKARLRPKAMSLQAALQNDERLEKLPVHKVIKVGVARGTWGAEGGHKAARSALNPQSAAWRR